MNNYLFATPFSTFEKWYVEYYLNTTRITSSYRMVKIENLIKPVKRKIKKNNYDGVLPIVSKIIFKSGEIMFRKENKTGMDLLLVNKGDLLISSINFHQGAVALNDKFDFVCSTHYQTFVIDEKQIYPEYLLKVMRSNKFIEMVSGIKANGIKNESGYEFIGSFEIPLPSLDNQKKLLQKYHDTLDEAERNRKSGDDYGANLLYDIQAKVSKLEKRKYTNSDTSLLSTVSLKAIKRWEVDYIQKEGRLEEIYNSFKHPWHTINDLQKESLFGLSVKASLEPSDGMIPVLRMTNIVDGDIDYTELKYLPYECATTQNDPDKWLLKDGDFLITRTNGSKDLVGKSAIFHSSETYTYASYLIRYRFDTTIVLPEYVNLLFLTPIVREQIAVMRRQGGGQYNLNSDEIGSIRIPVPSSLKEQQEIIDYYNKTKNGSKSYYEKADALVEKAKTDFEIAIFS